jgi:hypothetical protein
MPLLRARLNTRLTYKAETLVITLSPANPHIILPIAHSFVNRIPRVRSSCCDSWRRLVSRRRKQRGIYHGPVLDRTFWTRPDPIRLRNGIMAVTLSVHYIGEN